MRLSSATARRLMLWAAGAALLLLAANLHDPYLLAVRTWSAPVVVAAGIAGAVFSATHGRRGGRARPDALLITLWCAVPLTVLAGEAALRLHKQTVLTATAAEIAELGPRFVVGYTRAEEIRPLAVRGAIGGVFITRRNVEGRSGDALRDELAELQKARQDAGLPPLVVATDQEGGIVSRLSPPLTALPSLATLAALPAEQRTAAAHQYGATHGRELASLGVTMNFAPVADLRSEEAGSPFDLHTLIAHRAISSDPETVASVALAYALGLESAGVMPTVKHFPGLGRVAGDTHHVSAALGAPVAELERQDWVPFRHVLARSGAALMVGHVSLDAIDPRRPASLSRPVVQGVIRDNWHHHGLLVTDDMTMGAVYRRGICEATVDALNAGIDLLLISYDGEQYYKAMACALSAHREGKLDPTLTAQSHARLSARFGVIARR